MNKIKKLLIFVFVGFFALLFIPKAAASIPEEREFNPNMMRCLKILIVRIFPTL